ncbi:hypothetical protein SUGI_1076320 [Cryptomeria japonica]|uniref:F-box/kelch-repeat protein At5g15710-like n=1 Tax=Cryptomeria japonica TaxID=3369 RepID=UPI00241490CA|nr:F-box/kelch-repeat protein At5g15710-like [Cryptomeria japonica]GLJ50516.1 hypothetical protein SUGI_1076320 [Cryptomeria japonica]
MGKLRIPNQTMWSDLPEHLKERILECLPVHCFFRFRAVCKTWNGLFSSPYFNSIARNSQPFLILCPAKTQLPSLIYTFITHTWRTISLSFIPHDRPINFRGSASGLLLADINANFLFGYSSPTLCVCNPLTQTYSTLPEMVSVSKIMARTILPAGNKTEEYTVMVVGMSSTGTVVVEAYNSTTKAWKVVGSITDVVLKTENMFFFKGYLLGMTGSGGIMAYNIEEGITSVMAMPTADANNLRARLVCCKSGVFVVGAIEENQCLKGLIVWELVFQKTGKDDYKWKEIGKMPSCVCEEFKRSSNSNWFECVGVGDKICFRANESMEILVYDVSTSSWNWLPKFPADLRYVSMRCLPLEIMPTTRFS